MTMPLVSVLLPVYNGSRYLRSAIESVLQQTYDNFELIIINDGSTDSSAGIIASYTDPRLRCFEQENAGLSAALNKAISVARGSYLARQDSDDVSYPERLAKQVLFLENNPHCGMVGTWAEIWREERNSGRVHRHPAEDAVLQLELLFNNPFVHSSVMMRREVVASVGPYLCDRSRTLPEDYELWSRISRKYRVANIPEVLHVYRETEGSICRQNWDRLMDEVVSLSAGNIAWRGGLTPDDSDVVDLAAFANMVAGRFSGDPELARMRRVFLRAVDNVRRSSSVGEIGSFERAVRIRWRGVRSNYYRGGVWSRLLNLWDLLWFSR